MPPGARDDGSCWFDEIDLDPARPAVAMGTRALGLRPWLVADVDFDDQLELKRRLSNERHHDVFAALPQTAEPAAATADAVREEGFALVEDAGLHPLDRAGRSVQEDLCLIERRSDGWYLAGASLCFPTRWRLHDKLDRHVNAIHGPVTGYRDTIATRVDQLFDRLRHPVLRRNWFVHADASLFQPSRPDTERVVPAADVLEGLVVRSERQVLRPVGPPGWLLFSIKIQQADLGSFVREPGRASRFARYLADADPDLVAHRGLGARQVHELRRALAAHR